MVITGKWSDGSELVAVPNYARMNRVGPPHPYPSEEEAEFAASSSSTSGGASSTVPDQQVPAVRSKVWV